MKSEAFLTRSVRSKIPKRILEIQVPAARRIDGLLEAVLRGSSGFDHDLSEITQMVRTWASDSTLSLKEWVRAVPHSVIAAKVPEQHSISIGSALSSSFLIQKLLRDHPCHAVSLELCLKAAILKDIGFSGGHLAERGDHHASLGAALVAIDHTQQGGLSRLIREHHESLDGSGLPAGRNSLNLAEDSRVLSVISRWQEIWDLQQEAGTLADWERQIPLTLTMLDQESAQGRWDRHWTERLGSLLMKDAAAKQAQQETRPKPVLPPLRQLGDLKPPASTLARLEQKHEPIRQPMVISQQENSASTPQKRGRQKSASIAHGQIPRPKFLRHPAGGRMKKRLSES